MALAALSSMKNSLKRQLGEMTYTMKPVVLAHGINTIPDEILARIFECTDNQWSEDAELPQPEHLRLVCKRFRLVFDSQPSLKRRFTSGKPIKNIKNRLDGCGQVGLCVKIDTRSIKPHSAIGAFEEALITHAHRWEELHFLRIAHTREARQVHALPDEFKSLNLPRLERLVLWSAKCDAADRLYSTWTMPNLRRIVFHNGVPLGLPGKADLLECDLVLVTERIQWFTREISRFLGSLTSLTTLRLTFLEAVFGQPYNITSPIRLPNLRTLVADARFGFMIADSMAEKSGRVIVKLIECLEAPQLEKLFVNLNHDPSSEKLTSDLLNDLLHMHGKTGSLQTFTFTQASWLTHKKNKIESLPTLASTQESRMTYHDIGSVVKNPCNGNIVISGLDLGCYKHPDFSSHEGGTYGLQTLTFKNCKLSTDALEVLLKLYTTREWYPNFEGIILERCDDVTWEDLAGAAHSEHVFIRDDCL
jgi:hypothetical protein